MRRAGGKRLNEELAVSRPSQCNGVEITDLSHKSKYPAQGNPAAVMRRAGGKRLNEELAVSRPSQCNGVERVALGGKSHIARSELRQSAIRRGAGTPGRPLAGNLPWPGRVDRLAIDGHPGAELVQESEFIVVRPAMAGQRNVQQQIAVLADDIYQ